ncbi:ribonuclease HII [Pseudalkalibacillus hwajinpoensis]|uniref:ribonuclease HII n=1 Tax=Guptibacillus hwajinpoensis TaxID=208199 RepID=UPI001CD55840|nr:ribonuclease HII [Pseudalkalibacillus hwajinpoensis]MCA0990211.1 ribonuclease HII [Pseudalkalibacillus hwajinpoensis]
MSDQVKSIKEIDQMLKKGQYTNEDWDQWKQDERKGVVRLLAREGKKEQEKMKIRKMHEEMSVLEAHYRGNGRLAIAGVDEVGRGPLAGPVVASAVILDPEVPILGLQDSKKLSHAKLNDLFDQIHMDAVAIGVGVVSAAEIDELNIYQATKKAMQQAVEGLRVQADFLLVDAMHIPVQIDQESLIKGDARSVSIAAASIVAKVTRDRMMVKLAETYPEYGFERHVGYGTKEHLSALDEFGITEVHRKSFAPVRDRLSV